MRHILRALSSRNLRIYFLGQGVSLIGSWITTVASSWLVYRLSNSELLLGVVAFASQFPSAMLGPIAGVYIDRLNRRTVLLITQLLSMLQSLLLFGFAISGNITVETVIVLNLLQALVNAFDMPARQSFLSEVVSDKLDLPNAIALHSALFHGSRLIGPAIAGILVQYFGEAICFLIDGVSYGAVVLALLAIREYRPFFAHEHRSWWAAMREGVQYSVQSRTIRTVLLLVSVVSLCGTAHITLLPVFAKEVLGGGPRLYGVLMACSGCGAFFGALFLASRERGAKIRKIIVPMPMALGAALIVFALARSPVLAGCALLFASFAMVTLIAGGNSIVQVTVEDSKRARVMSLFSASFFGMMPLGGLLAGAVASHLGAATTVVISGVLDVLIGLWCRRMMQRGHECGP